MTQIVAHVFNLRNPPMEAFHQDNRPAGTETRAMEGTNQTGSKTDYDQTSGGSRRGKAID